ncbi:MAG: RNA polymerase sigma factor [Thermodesulfobacteriota bacterium]|nr:RNA polymerase sigma factor [Thermodesulfobacteriota bacterium]
MGSNLEAWVDEARKGNRQALEQVVRSIQDKVYALAFRMLGHPADAEDAAQEILVKVITHLVDFRGESAFTSWVYRIASNHLLNIRKRRAERLGITFQLWEDLIHKETGDKEVQVLPEAEENLLAEEVRIGCMQGLLICLDRDERLAFILGDVFEVTSKEGAYILGVTPEAFRKRVSRGRKRLQAFMLKNCGLVNPQNSCRCDQQVYRDLQSGWITRDKLHFAGKPCHDKKARDVTERLKELEEMVRVVALFRSYPDYAAPDSFGVIVKDLIDSGRYKILTE